MSNSRVYCSIVGCQNNPRTSPELEFYRFPASNPLYPHRAVRREIWISAIRRQELDGSPWQPKKDSRICSSYFIGNRKSEDPRSPSYNPTIFPNIYKKSQINTTVAVGRYERRIKRSAPQQTTSFKKSRDEPSSSVLSDFPSETENPPGRKSSSVNQGTQVDFIEDDENSNSHLVFICNHYVNFISNVCHAETQTSGPRTSKRVIVDKPTSTNTKDKNIPTDESTTKGFYGFSCIKSDQEMLDLAGVTQNTYQLLLKVLSMQKIDERQKISRENRLLIFLVNMKSALTFSATGVLFSVHRSTVSRIFYSMLDCFSIACKNFVTWPSREVVNATMPAAFRESYSNCRVIIDCTEFRVEQPPTVEQRVQFYSHYKKGFRIKISVGCTPCGLVSIVSKAYGGRATDAQITNRCSLLDLLEPGDMVLADKGFPQIKTILNESGRNILLVMPPFLHNNTFTEEQVEDTYKVASVRIHIERIMQRLRNHNILDMLTIDMLPHCDKIIFMCCVLVNLQPPIFKQNESEGDM